MRRGRSWRATGLTLGLLLGGCATTPETVSSYDVVLRGGTIYDGSGGEGRIGDVAIRGDRIVAIAPRIATRGRTEIAARGLAVAPGFINMLSWANTSLISDGRAQNDIRQGVTLEVMGEGTSSGPLNPAMRDALTPQLARMGADVSWTTLGGYLRFLEARGVSPNVASFVGATTVRQIELGENDVDPTPEQLTRMRKMVRVAMDEGAMGVGSSLIYVPATYAETDELVALANEAGRCGGMYISHIRDEGPELLAAIDELIAISQRARVRAEAYHLKASRQANWPKMAQAIARIEAARAAGLPVSANMYLYTASGTGLDSTLPVWVREGGRAAMIERLKQPEIRARVATELAKSGRDWSTVQPTNFRNPALRVHAAKRLPAIAAALGKSNEEAVIELIVQDESRVGTIFHTMSEDNVRLGLVQPWVSFGSDAGTATVPTGAAEPTHPREYGNFARLLGRYVRDEKLLTLGEAVRKLTSLPAANLGIKDRGALKTGHFADIAVFDPLTISDKATFEDSHQYSVGMRHVFVNGVPVLKDGEHTGAKPGRFVKGPGAGRCPAQ